MRKFNYILNDIAFDTLVTKCLYAEPTDEDIKECENQIELLKQENHQLKDRIEKAMAILKEHFVEEYVRSCDTEDGVGYYEIDKYHWTYETYQILKGEENE